MVATLFPQPARNAAAKTSRTSLRNIGGGGYSPPTVARLPRSMSSSRIDCMRRSALASPRLVQPRLRVAASMNLSVSSADAALVHGLLPPGGDVLDLGVGTGRHQRR